MTDYHDRMDRIRNRTGLPPAPKTHTCSTCGYVWLHGQHGGHRCSEYMAKTIDHLKVEMGRLEERDKRHLAYTASLRDQLGEEKTYWKDRVIELEADLLRVRGYLKSERKAALDTIRILRAQRHDLLMAVGKKYPGETRHETAKRYIVEAETSSN